MKKSFIIFALLSGFVLSAMTGAAQQYYLDEGEPVVAYPAVEWIKGEPITSFDKDKIYIVELWATWCKPCVAAIPHLNELNKLFKDKIVFIGQNVMEEGKDKVAEFVAKQVPAMDYRVAYSGADKSDFDKKWVKASGTMAIPRTFVIQDNKLVWMTHPDTLNPAVLQLLVDKKFTKETALKLQKKK